MKRAFYMGAAIVVVSLPLILQARFGVSARIQAAAAQGENVLVRVPSPREPVEVSKLQVGGSDITAGAPFAGDENWVGALSGRVKNTSGKVITDLQMTVNFDSGGPNPRKVAIPLAHSEPILPNQTVRVSAPAAGIASLRAMLAKQGLAANFRRGELRTQYAKFQDGSVWVKGVTLGPRDPQTGRRKRM
jgi:hypothetical protein